MSEITECYEILGCQYGDSIPSIKARFMKLCLEFHPDKGGDKDFFDLICKSYKTIRRIRRDERMPRENIKYKIEEEFKTGECNNKSIEQMIYDNGLLNGNPGYDQFTKKILSKYPKPRKHVSYDPNDLGNLEFKGFKTESGHSIVQSNLSPDINYSGRTTDSKQYFGIVEYGKFGTKFGGKSDIEGYDLGQSYNETNVIYETLDNDNRPDVDDILQQTLQERELQDQDFSSIKPLSDSTRNKIFDEENQKFTLETQKAFDENKKIHMKKLEWRLDKHKVHYTPQEENKNYIFY